VEGRDIGTVVFPDAPVKVFLTAHDDVRAARRRRDEEAASRAVAVDDVRDAITARDRADSSLGRALRPEDAADDAMVIDTSTTDVEDVVGAIVHRARVVAERSSPGSGSR
jgi:cytidylate kinase